MTSLVPERMLLFSPALAATIGLEEAILLHLLSDVASLAPSTKGWVSAELAMLATALPFWGRRDLLRIARNLADKGVLQLDERALAASDRLTFHFIEGEAAAAAASPAASTTGGAAVRGGAQPLHPSWRPDEDLLQLLAMNHGITRAFAMDQLDGFFLYWRERGEVRHSWSSLFHQHVLSQWRRAQQRTAEAVRPAGQTPAGDWFPSEDALQILERSGITRTFIEDAVPEFVLYWRERGDNTDTWNSKFVGHIRRQWDSYVNALKHDREPRPIPPNWQPNEDVNDILRMANIDQQFARDLLPEFILFWRDAGTPQRSWNTKFLQHVKYQWATRHHLRYGASHAGQQLPGGATAAAPQSAFDRLTDRSWAAGLVDGQ